MYLAGGSVRRVEDIIEALWGTKVSASTISDLNKKAYVNIEKLRNRPIDRTFSLCVRGRYMLEALLGRGSSRCLGACRNRRRVGRLSRNTRVCEGEKEDKEAWLGFLRSLKERGLHGVSLFISDRCLGLVEALQECLPAAQWQNGYFNYTSFTQKYLQAPECAKIS
jgi:putative transposase